MVLHRSCQQHLERLAASCNAKMPKVIAMQQHGGQISDSEREAMAAKQAD